MLRSDSISKIQELYNSYQNPDTKCELEVRFGSKEKGTRTYLPGLEWKIFKRALVFLDEKGWSKTVTRSTDYYDDATKIRKTVVKPSSDVGNEQVFWITKEKVWTLDPIEYPIRIAFNKEIEKPDQGPQFNKETLTIREKNRTSYDYANGTMRIDCTEVSMKNKQGFESLSYEIELELLDRKYLNSFEKAIVEVFCIVYGTDIIYTQTDKERIIVYLNKFLGSMQLQSDYDTTSDFRYIIDRMPLVQARNLKYRDCVYGGIVNNNRTVYKVTHKADGERKLFVVHETGIWLVSPPDDLNKVVTTLSNLPLEFQKFKGALGLILDGEYIPQNRLRKRFNVKNFFAAFDCLSVPFQNQAFPNTSIQDLPHSARLHIGYSYGELFKDNSLVYVHFKKFTTLISSSTFFETMTQMFNEQNTGAVLYLTDGLLITPEVGPYNPYKQKGSLPPLKERNLTMYPDICKWKPVKDLTIDFLVKRVINNYKTYIELYSYDTISRKYVKFPGNAFVPFKDEIDFNNSITLNIPDGKIVEYKWENKMFVPKEIRHNKTQPNSLEIALDIWEDIHNPITENVLTGKEFVFQKKYFNTIKRQLYNNVNIKGSKKTLLDIGAGWGQTVDSYKDFDKIVSVEPNAENITQLRQRIKSNNLENRVSVVQAFGQEFDRIINAVKEHIGSRVDVISCMLSLSYFWTDENTLNAFLTTIASTLAHNGKLIFLTIDGDIVKEFYSPTLSTYSIEKFAFDQNHVILTYNPDRSVTTTVKVSSEKTTIVPEKTVEYPPRLCDMMHRISSLEGLKFTLTNISRTVRESFMTDSEIKWSEMFTYGIFEFTMFEPSIEPKLLKITTPETPLFRKVSINDLTRSSKLSTRFQPMPYISKIKQVDRRKRRTSYSSYIRQRLADEYTENIRNAELIHQIDEEYNRQQREKVQKQQQLQTQQQTSQQQRQQQTPIQTPSPGTTSIAGPTTGFSQKSKVFSTSEPSFPKISLPIETFNQLRILQQQSSQQPSQQPSQQSQQQPQQEPSQQPQQQSIQQFIQSQQQSQQQQLQPSQQQNVQNVFIPIRPLKKQPNREREIPQTFDFPKIAKIPQTMQTIQRESLLSNISRPDELKPIPIIYNQATDVSIGDDAYEFLTLTWFNKSPILRLGTLQYGGSGIIHSILKAFYTPYVTTRLTNERMLIVSRIRRDLAYGLIYATRENPQITYYTYFSFKDSLESIQQIINSNKTFPREYFGYLAKILKLDIYILRATRANVFLEEKIESDPQEKRPCILILGINLESDPNYELCVMKNGRLFQTVFSPNDELVKAIEENLE